VDAVQQQIDDLNAAFKSEVDGLARKVDPATEPLDSVTVRPKKTNITIRLYLWRGLQSLPHRGKNIELVPFLSPPIEQNTSVFPIRRKLRERGKSPKLVTCSSPVRPD